MAWEIPGLNLAASGQAAGNRVAGLFDDFQSGLLGSEALMVIRKAGLQKVDDIITDAILNPDRALMLLRKAPAKPTKRDSITFAQRYRRAAVLPAAIAFGGE